MSSTNLLWKKPAALQNPNNPKSVDLKSVCACARVGRDHSLRVIHKFATRKLVLIDDRLN